MVIKDSNGGGVDVAGTIGGASRMIGEAEDIASGVGTVEGVVGASGMISIGISACCACGGCSSCGGSRGAGISEVPGGEALVLGLRVDGDAAWAPLVLAMAEMEMDCLACVPQVPWNSQVDSQVAPFRKLICRLRKWKMNLRNGTRVPEGAFAGCENFRKLNSGLANLSFEDFASWPSFSQVGISTYEIFAS
uniref:Uncharacterized protein n=1 Tax=Vitis vinifera TaxID=29760 RepID=A5BV98_VITVI|nr:hypothetical protein VITISV_011369 [Vitis vinifera]